MEIALAVVTSIVVIGVVLAYLVTGNRAFLVAFLVLIAGLSGLLASYSIAGGLVTFVTFSLIAVGMWWVNRKVASSETPAGEDQH